MLRSSCCARCISIHAPARGATEKRDPIIRKPLFQFTPLREGRPLRVHMHHAQQHVHISIHAPARGATSRFSAAKRNPVDFNSRPCERGDAPGTRKFYAHNLAYFNSRPCERGDTGETSEVAEFCIFQFTPLREGRRHQPYVLH
mgnify:CR=1 FL=1